MAFWDDYDGAQPGYEPRTAAPGGVPPAQAPAPADPNAPRYSGPNAAMGAYLERAYKELLGRDASVDEIQARLNDPRFNYYTHYQSIQNSPEARQYASQPQTPQGPAAGGGGTPGRSSLMETTAGIGDRAQMLKSPKAAFLSVASKYGYNELDKVLAELQADPELARFFKDWKVGGRGDVLEFGGDPSTLAQEWGGVRSFDVIGDYDPATGKARGWRWGVGEGAGGGSGAPGASITPTGDGGSYGAYGGGYASQGGNAGGAQRGLALGNFDPYQYETFNAPEPFQAPTLAEAAADPGYEFGRTEGQRAIERSAAARGQLGKGGTLKDIAAWGNDYATTKYNDVYGRRASEYDRRFGNALGVNQANNQGRLAGFGANTNAALGFGNLDLGYYSAGNQYDLGRRNNALGYYTADQSYDLGLRGNDLGWANYGLNAQGQRFNQGFALTELGYRSAAQQGAYGSQYAGNAGNYYTQQGNARAAGRMGSANAWANGIGNVSNYAAEAGYAAAYPGAFRGRYNF